MGQFQGKPRELTAREKDLEDFLREQTEDFARIWLVISDQWYRPKIVRPLHPATFSKHWLFGKKKNVEFYEVGYTDTTQAYPLKLERALRTWNTCLSSVYVVYERVEQRLMSLPQVQKVEWIGVVPNPRLMLIWKGTGRNEEIMREHDCLLITTFNDSQYVLDVSSWQFGYDDFFFSWANYKSNFIAPGQDIKVRVPADEYACVHVQYADELRSLTFLQHYREWVMQASDTTLKEVGKGVSLL
ncbi:hypothetical protein BU23DRAFT_575816 [Bimuria novae-zelandiae CBS 107.79]|uniref:Uncharacterized protein n=1 Tax=Bimuria novae-zelandiae CBS 107.79 TaxID=1447943 RepID=A0A6A5UH83_9PLEO|nr:hypothetical protein BU23DRAFT_575816 [Bimuria novae-zelandiae CBS 107.79]